MQTRNSSEKRLLYYVEQHSILFDDEIRTNKQTTQGERSIFYLLLGILF